MRRPIARQRPGRWPSSRRFLTMCWSTNRQLALRADESLTFDGAEGEEVAMARGATHLLIMAVVGISLLLGHTARALSQEVPYERLLNADKDPHNWPMYYRNYK